MSELYGCIADLEMPYFACFRKPASTSVILTYPVPPFTTIIGLIANALGVPRPAYTPMISWLQETLRLNLRPLKPLGRPNRELAKILKLVGEPREERKPTSFPSSPMHKYFLARASYRVYLAASDPDEIDEIAAALRRPARPLYLGQSDDLVIVTVSWQGEAFEVESDRAWGLVPGVHEAEGQRVEVLKLPLAFEGERTLKYTPVVSLPERFPLKLKEPIVMWHFGEETVPLFPFEEGGRE
mgnify:CR=1 FL=1|jgi:CRISPR-associated protein Cas5h